MFLQKLVNGILFIYFLFMTIATPLFHGQSCLPTNFFPKFLVDIKSHYVEEHSDYLVGEQPDFFVGLIWVNLLVQWPLCIANLYAIITNKSWFKKTCLIYGVFTASGLVAILSELIRSPKAPLDLVYLYARLMGFALFAILNGLVPLYSDSSVNVTRPPVARKKRA
ncbi:Transmembrane protein 6/97 [Macleaya cordata]|uniref:Transmembrane protein 6/97 n=1 Tax=Macleaya cordata TaxID=56857 RepID=A0A200QL12_MACCD|nr:Transmembrane protein 6/97 [Macleaya cordata]